jgi:two-component system phosphate regulon response regulator PhoB
MQASSPRGHNGSAVTKREKIVVIEDEADILEVIHYNLTREGYRVSSSRDGEEGLDRVRREAPDLVLLDLMLPGLDGLEVCRRLQSDPVTAAIPVIMVTAKGEESDIVLGLSLGADDYVTKPFSPRELLARVKAVLRRGPPRDERGGSERIVRDGLVIDVLKHQVLVDGEPATMTATELRLLHFLASHPGRVFTRDQLLSRVIGDQAVVIDRNIDVHVGAIRKKLGRYRDMVETIRGVGYRFLDLPAS